MTSFAPEAEGLIRTMRTFSSLAVVLLALSAPSAGARPSENTWVVVSKAELDPRVRHQLEQLAAQDQALIHFFTSASEARGFGLHPGALSIELHEEGNPDDFLRTLRREAAAAAVEPTPALAREGYILEALYPHASVPSHLGITAAAPEGFHNALRRIPDLLEIWPANLPRDLIPPAQAVRVEKNGRRLVLSDFPSFPERGVVEGFYGTPWTRQDRIDILRFEGAHGMNVYYYAPKDDPYQRKLWRRAYPAEDLARLAALVGAARSNFVDFCFAISPGLSMAYSSEQDFRALTEKLASVSRLGVSCFALFLDDVPQDLEDPHDLAQFKTLAQAHAYLTNRLYHYLRARSPGARMVLTPTTYTNEWGSLDYLQELAVGVDAEVPIVWTGPKVFSPTVTVEQARAWTNYIHRPPLVWDNFPVNDGTPWCRYLGPLAGRDPHLPSAVRGLFANPMIQPHASMIPLETIADYLWNPQAYDPAKSEAHAVTSQYGKDAPRLLAPFLNAYGTYAWEDGIFTPLFSERRRPLEVGRMRQQLQDLKAGLARLEDQKRFEPLLREISPAVERTASRLAEVEADPAFVHLPGGRLQWNENYEALSAYELRQPPELDGDFSKWRAGPLYRLDHPSQIVAGADKWRGPPDLSALVGLAWDTGHLYVGVEVVDPDLDQPFWGRGIAEGDTFLLWFETAFRENFFQHEPTGDEYALFFSPGNFVTVKPSVFSDEDYLPRRARPHNYFQEILTAWKKTARGYSGDIAIPASFFAAGKFGLGYELGLGFGVRRVLSRSRAAGAENPDRIELQSKRDHLFPVTPRNPGSFPRLVLVEGKP